MHVDQVLTKCKENKGKKDGGKKVLNYFLPNRLYPDVELYRWKNTGKIII